jgi:hypothetical protein
VKTDVAKTASVNNNAYYNFYIISLVPFLWLSGLDFMAFHLMALFLVFRRGVRLRPDGYFDVLFFLAVTVLCLSLALSSAQPDIDEFRMVAALNNISILVIGFVFMKSASTYEWGKPFDAKKRSIARRFRLLTAGTAGMTLFAVVLYYVHSQNIVFPTLFGLFTPKMAGLLGEYQEATLVIPNWFLGGMRPRVYLFAPFATGSALVIIFIFAYSRILTESEYGWGGRVESRLTKLGVYTAAFGAVVATLSRATIGGFALSLIVANVLRTFRRTSIPVFLLVAPIGVSLLTADSDWFSSINEARQGSSELRFYEYQLAFETVMDQSPIVGLGVKPRVEGLAIPIGSHSTPLSVLVRGGVIASLALCIFLYVMPIYYIIRILHSKLDGVPASVFMLMACYFPYALYILVQDVDAYPIVSCCCFTYVGLLRSLSRHQVV